MNILAEKKKQKVYVNDLISDLEWTIFMAKSDIMVYYGITKSTVLYPASINRLQTLKQKVSGLMVITC